MARWSKPCGLRASGTQLLKLPLVPLPMLACLGAPAFDGRWGDAWRALATPFGAVALALLVGGALAEFWTGVFVSDVGVRVRVGILRSTTVPWSEIDHVAAGVVPGERILLEKGAGRGLIVAAPSGGHRALPVRATSFSVRLVRRSWPYILLSHEVLDQIVARINELAAAHNGRPVYRPHAKR